MIQPIAQADATGLVSDQYREICRAFGAMHVPLFFTYVAPFPQYLTHLTSQMHDRLSHEQFIRKARYTADEVGALMQDCFVPNRQIQSWRKKQQSHAQYALLIKHIEEIHALNIKLAFYFLALREQVKGWAIPVGKQNTAINGLEKTTIPASEQEICIYGNEIIAATGTAGHLLAEYLDLCRASYSPIREQAVYWQVRVAAEKVFLAVLPLMPELVFSPVNVTIDLTKEYDAYPDLLHLLSDQFPTLAMQRLLFSSYVRLAYEAKS